MSFAEIVIQLEKDPMASAVGKRLQSTLPRSCLHQASQNSHKRNCQTKVCKKRGFTHSVCCFLQSSALLARPPFLPALLCCFFLQFHTYLPPNTSRGRKAWCLFRFLPRQPSHCPFQYPSCLCQGKSLRKPRAGYIWKGPMIPGRSLGPAAPASSALLLHKRPAALPRAWFLSTCADRKGRRRAESELKSRRPRQLLPRSFWKSDGHCLYCYYCYQGVAGVFWVYILLTRCKQRKKFIADPCKLANINTNVKSSLKKKCISLWDAWNCTRQKCLALALASSEKLSKSL